MENDAKVEDIKGFKSLKELRLLKGLSQVDVAKYLNITKSMMSKIENGSRGLTVDHLVMLSKVYGVSIDRLVECVK